MNLIKKLLLGAAGLAVLVCVVAFLLPRTAHVERSIVINAPPATVFTVLNGFRQFKHWSPWQDVDPDMKVVYEGPATGVGAKLSWSGNSQVGTGSQEILESMPYSRIVIRLVFGDFAGDFIASYALEPEGTGTRFTWGFDADYGNSVMGRYFGLLSDSMLGPDYEKGLAKLKAYVETLPKADFSGLELGLIETTATPIVFASSRSANEPNAIGVALGVAYGKVSGFLSANGAQSAGQPLAIYHGEQNGLQYFDAAIPVNRSDIAPAGEIRTGQTPAGLAVKAVYRGSYAGLGAANEQVKAFLTVAGYETDGPHWEQYISDPGSTPEAELITHIYYPVK